LLQFTLENETSTFYFLKLENSLKNFMLKSDHCCQLRTKKEDQSYN